MENTTDSIFESFEKIHGILYLSDRSEFNGTEDLAQLIINALPNENDTFEMLECVEALRKDPSSKKIKDYRQALKQQNEIVKDLINFESHKRTLACGCSADKYYTTAQIYFMTEDVYSREKVDEILMNAELPSTTLKFVLSDEHSLTIKYYLKEDIEAEFIGVDSRHISIQKTEKYLKNLI